MDFFRSILSDDPEPESDPTNRTEQIDDVMSPESDTGTTSGAWSFGDLVKTLTTKSESVFETYKRDLKEFGTELRKESDLFRDVAIRAVNELPEAGTSALDNVLKSTVDIISQVASSNDNVDDNESDRGSNERKFSRFDAKLNAIRRDERTYVEEVDDVEDYEKWKREFVVGDKKDEIEKLVGENGVLAGVYEKLVLNGNVVDDGTFWFRYFYKVYRMEVQEEMRAKLVKRSLSSFDDEEDLSWDVDDDEEEEGEKLAPKVVKIDKMDNVDDNVVNVEEPIASDENVLVVEKDEKVDVEEESSEVKDSSNVVEKTNEEEDLEWDEIEDLGENDDKKVSESDAADKDELRKRLSTAAADDDEEDLSWDIEDDDDDEHVKYGGNK